MVLPRVSTSLKNLVRENLMVSSLTCFLACSELKKQLTSFFEARDDLLECEMVEVELIIKAEIEFGSYQLSIQEELHKLSKAKVVILSFAVHLGENVVQSFFILLGHPLHNSRFCHEIIIICSFYCFYPQRWLSPFSKVARSSLELGVGRRSLARSQPLTKFNCSIATLPTNLK